VAAGDLGQLALQAPGEIDQETLEGPSQPLLQAAAGLLSCPISAVRPPRGRPISHDRFAQLRRPLGLSAASTA